MTVLRHLLVVAIAAGCAAALTTVIGKWLELPRVRHAATAAAAGAALAVSRLHRRAARTAEPARSEPVAP